MALRGSTKLLVADVHDWEVERETVSRVNTPPHAPGSRTNTTSASQSAKFK